MPKTKYQKATDLLNTIIEKYGRTIPFSLLKKEIIMHLGADHNRTVKPYVKLMLELEMVEQVEDTPNVIIHI